MVQWLEYVLLFCGIGEKRLIVTAPYKVDHDAALKSRLSGRALSDFVFRTKVYE